MASTGTRVDGINRSKKVREENAMSGPANQIQGMPRAEFFGPARVLEVDVEGGRIQVMMAASDSTSGEASTPRSAWAELALASPAEIQWGDTVLVAGQAVEELYIIGLLGRAQAAPSNRAPTPPLDESVLALRSGARAERATHGDSESLKVYSEEGRLLFEYDPERKSSRVDLPPGNVEFVSKQGRIDFIAPKGIGFFSQAPIELMSARSIKLAAANALDKTYSAFELGKQKISMKSEQLDIEANEGDVQIDRAEFKGTKLTSTLKVVKLVAERSETTVGTAIEKAKNVYRKVEELSQLETGRLRTMVKDLYQLKSRSTIMKSDKAVKIDGETIHLG
jgi:hypothetical protein